MTQPQVSVIIPVHNGAGTVKKAVDSVLAQSVAARIYIVDDASSDDTQKVLSAYAGNETVTLLKNETNLGVSASRMRGVSEAETEYIAFLDADDWWAEDKLEKQLAAMRDAAAVLSSTGRLLVAADGTPTRRYIGIPERIDLGTELQSNYINCSGVIVKRDVMLEFPMEHDDSHEDYISWIRIIRRYGFAVGVDEPLLFYRLSEKSKSSNKLRSAAMNFRVYRYCGYSVFASIRYSFSYVCNGIRKYFL